MYVTVFTACNARILGLATPKKKLLCSTIKYLKVEILSPIACTSHSTICTLIRLIRGKLLRTCSCLHYVIHISLFARRPIFSTHFDLGVRCTEFAFAFFAIHFNDKLSLLRLCRLVFFDSCKKKYEWLPYRIISLNAKIDEIASIFNGNLIR